MNTQTIPRLIDINKQLTLLKASPFSKVCPSCRETFEAHHMLQIYCPEKYGVKDFCKYQQKKKREEEKKSAKVNVPLKVLRHGRIFIKPKPITKLTFPVTEASSNPSHKLGGEIQSLVYKLPLTVQAQPSIVPVISKSLPAMNEVPINEVKRSKCIKIIEKLLNGKRWRELSEEEIDATGLDFSLFDKKIPLPNSNLFRTEIGNYSLFWTHANKLLITKITEILWISQC